MTGSKRTVFVAGATGSMGLAAAGALIEAGQTVVGVARSPDGAAALRDLGAAPVEVSLFDVQALTSAMRGADAVVHFATKVPSGTAMVRPGAWKTNDRLRREGTRALLRAAEANGIRRFIFESLALAYPDHGESWIDEGEPLRPIAPTVRTAIEAEAQLEEFGRRGGEPVSLRFGRIYGPGRASRVFLEMVARRQMPVVGSGKNFVSSIHVDDIGTAVVATLDAPPGVYNVVDDEPLTQMEYLREVARALGAPEPRRLPYALARIVMGRTARLVAASQRVSNRRLRETTGWTPRYRSAREGWPVVVRAEQRLAAAFA